MPVLILSNADRTDVSIPRYQKFLYILNFPNEHEKVVSARSSDKSESILVSG